MGNQEQKPLWTPSPERIAGATITRFMREAGAHHGIQFADYAALHRWSVDHMEPFWREIWSFCGVIGEGPGEHTLINHDAMPGARFFPDAKINFAENLLRPGPAGDDADALVFWGEDKTKRRLTYRELADEVSRAQQALRAQVWARATGCARLSPTCRRPSSACWPHRAWARSGRRVHRTSACRGYLDRFGQIEPKVLIAVDGYYYNGKTIDILDKVAEVRSKLPSVQRVVVVPYVHPGCVAGGHRLGPLVGRLYAAVHGAGRRLSSACRSIIRSTSCIPAAPPACPSASSTAPAAR